MEAKELRLDNIVGRGYMNPIPTGKKKAYQECEIKALGIEKVIVNETIGRNGLIKMDYINIKPIALTEEWLLKFGYFPCEFRENHFYIQGHTIWKCNDFFTCDKNGIVLKYVHQLQNLYFALTGEELTIKE